MAQSHKGADGKRSEPQAPSQSQALANAAKFAAVPRFAAEPDLEPNCLRLLPYLLTDVFHCRRLREGPADSYMVLRVSANSPAFCSTAPENAVRLRQLARVFTGVGVTQMTGLATAAGLSFEPNTL